MKPVTLSDVALAAGVSKATASNVFNAPDKVRPVLRERVEEAAIRMGYFGPDPKGRMLSSGLAHTIGVVMPGHYEISAAFNNPYMRDFLLGISEICVEYGVGLALIPGIDDRKGWGISNALVDGFILGHIDEVERVETAQRRHLPFVVMDSDGSETVSSVRVDDRGGGRLAAQHLVDLGHRNFAVVTASRRSGGPILHGPSEVRHRLVAGYALDSDRLDGIADVLAGIGVSIDDVPVIEINANEGVAEGAAMLLDCAPETTAVICVAGDPQAIGVLDEARRRGLVVPRDLSVIGFDDVPEAALADPPLSSVSQPTAEKGRMAARMLLAGGPPGHVLLPVKLALRASTAAPPKR